jgi:hypothetical protein
MSELAFTNTGEPFDVPPTATGWRVRRMPPRGSKAPPDVVYGRDGVPLVLPIDATMEDLRAEVDEPGRYRLDPLDERGTPIDKAPLAYVFVREPAASKNTKAPAPTGSSVADHIIIEAIRHNAELARQNAEIARTVLGEFPQMMASAAQLLAAADGAGLPARPAVPADDDEDGEDDDEETVPAPEKPDLLGQLAQLAQFVPLIKALLEKHGADLPNFAEVLDWNKAYAAGQKNREQRAKQTPAPQTPPPASSTPPSDAALGAKIMQVFGLLTPQEQMLAMATANEMTAELRAQWMAELSPLPASEAADRVRALLGAVPTQGAPARESVS